MPHRATPLPSFDTESLSALALAFSRRGKAIRYWGKLTVEWEREEGSVDSVERLDVEFRRRDDLALRVSLWADGAMWLRVCKRKPGRNQGWQFVHHFHGTALEYAPAEVVELFEKSMSVESWPDRDRCARLREVWHRAGPHGGR